VAIGCSFIGDIDVYSMLNYQRLLMAIAGYWWLLMATTLMAISGY